MIRLVLHVVLGIIMLSLVSCEREPLPWTGGIDAWAEQDYGQATYLPDSSWIANAEMTYSLYQPQEGYASIVLNRNNEWGELREVLSFTVPEPRLGCYSLGSKYASDGSYRPLSTAIFWTLIADGDAITENYMTGDEFFPSEICFTGISSDRTRFQGTFSVSLQHDTLGPPIYLDQRPAEFKLIDGRFQVSLYQ